MWGAAQTKSKRKNKPALVHKIFVKMVNISLTSDGILDQKWKDTSSPTSMNGAHFLTSEYFGFCLINFMAL